MNFLLHWYCYISIIITYIGTYIDIVTYTHCYINLLHCLLHTLANQLGLGASHSILISDLFLLDERPNMPFPLSLGFWLFLFVSYLYLYLSHICICIIFLFWGNIISISLYSAYSNIYMFLFVLMFIFSHVYLFSVTCDYLSVCLSISPIVYSMNNSHNVFP